MKFFLGIMFLALSSAASANSFNQFVGDYEIAGSVEILANADFCNRFDLRNLLGLRVIVDKDGYQQSHKLYFLKANGASGHPVSEFNYQNEFDKTIGSFSEVRGLIGEAVVTNGSYASTSEELFAVSLKSLPNGVRLSVMEKLLKNGNVIASCEYNAQLTKK